LWPRSMHGGAHAQQAGQLLERVLSQLLARDT